MKLRLFTCLFVATASLVACFENSTGPKDSLVGAVDEAALEYLGSRMSPDRGANLFNEDLDGLDLFHLPIEVGNRWSYRRLVAFETSFEGEEPTIEWIRGSVAEEMSGITELFGREYVESESAYDEGTYGISYQTTYYRQDQDGLYEADLPIDLFHKTGAVRQLEAWRARAQDDPLGPAMLAAADQLERKLRFMASIRDAAKDVLDNEITRLSYPLSVGNSWTIREDPLFRSRVEGIQRLRLPAGDFVAWRVRIDSPLFGPYDRAYLFVGRAGFLGHAFRAEGVMTDEGGQVIGHLRSHDRAALVDYDLVAR